MAKEVQPDTFKKGDIVKLKSGGPKMTVEERIYATAADTLIAAAQKARSEPGERYRCEWFAGSKHDSNVFNVESLLRVEEGDGGK